MKNLCFLFLSLVPIQTPPAPTLPDLNKVRTEWKAAQAALDAAKEKEATARQAYLDALKQIADAAAEDGVGKPTPVDQFDQAIRVAWAATPAGEKALVPKLAEFFSKAQVNVDNPANVDSQTLLFQVLLPARRASVCTDAQLKALRKAIDDGIQSVMGPKEINVLLTPEIRKALKDQFQKTVVALNKLGGK